MNCVITSQTASSCNVCQRVFSAPASRLRGHRALSQNVQATANPQTCTGAQSRRQLGQAALLALTALNLRPQNSFAAGLPEEKKKMICDTDCQSKLESIEMVTTSSGLKYKDIVKGSGSQPPVGYQVVANYVAMTPQGKVFDSSLDRGAPYDIRVGSGQVIPGLDEGLRTMQPGGIRRMYIPGNLAFPKGVPSGAGRPRIPPGSPVVFDVQLVYVPGAEE